MFAIKSYGARGGVIIGAVAITALSFGGGCGDRFASCKENRTCPLTGGGSSASGGNGGDDDGDASNAGAGVDETAVGGGGRSGDDGDGGKDDVENGGAPQAAVLSVVKTQPEDLATDVERDAPIQVTFTTSLDPKSVTAESFKVTNEDGAVQGELAAKGETVTFTPRAKYPLLAEYTVKVSTAIKSADGIALDEAVSFGFQARDGKWRTPERISKAASGVRVEASRSGHAVAYWIVPSSAAVGAPERAEAAVFDPATATWGKVTTLVEDQATSYSVDCVSINEGGEAFATFSSTAGGAWSRRIGNAWQVPHLHSIENSQHCALGDDGTLTTAWLGKAGELAVAQLLPNDKWQTTQSLRAKTNPVFVRSFGDGFFIVSHDDNHAFLSHTYTPNGGWSAAKPVGSGGYPRAYALATLNARAMMAWFDMSNVGLHASVYEGSDWSKAVDIAANVDAYALSASIGGSRDLLIWADKFDVWVRFREKTGAWGESTKLANDGREPEAIVDDGGNALAVWAAENGNVTWRRWSTSSNAWSEPLQLKDQESSGYNILRTDSLGNVLFVWQNALGVWSSRFE